MARNAAVAIWIVVLFSACSAKCALSATPGLSQSVDSKASGTTAILKGKISVDYKDVDIADILRSLSYTYGLNLVTSSEVKGKITISLKDVTITEALEAILSANGYNYSRKGDIFYISPGSVEGSQAVTEAITLKYLKAVDVQNLVRKVLSSKGDIKVDEISNILVVTDYPASIVKLKELLKDVDQPPRQVLIEAKIVDITSKDLQNLGVTWAADYAPGQGIFGRNTLTSEQIKITQALSGTSSSISGGQFKLDTLVVKGLTATAVIDALVQTQKAHLLASPSIAVLNNREARIIIGEKVPYKEKTQTTTGTSETTKYIDVGTTLRVTPSINADGYITLAIHPEVSSVSALLDAGPRITTREADTIVRVKEGETIVIGGLIKQEDNRIKSRVPVLGYIPILEYFFSSRSRDQTQTELAVFITPKILLSRAERLTENKTRYEEEAYINILGTASLNVQKKLFDKAKKLQSGEGFEAQDKEVWQRRNQAVSMYENIVTQFPDGPKAAESAYQAAVLYNLLGEYLAARNMCEKILSEYSSSAFANKAVRLRRVLNARLRKRDYVRAEADFSMSKRAMEEEQLGLKKDVQFYSHLQKRIERDNKENTERKKLEADKLSRVKGKNEELLRLKSMRQAVKLEKEMCEIYRTGEARKNNEARARLREETSKQLLDRKRMENEARQKAEEDRRVAKEEQLKKASAERAEQARLRSEASLKAKEQARLKEEARQKAEEDRRVAKEEQLKKASAERAEQARLRSDASLKAKEQARLKEEADKAARLKLALDARLKREAQLKAKAESVLSKKKIEEEQAQSKKDKASSLRRSESLERESKERIKREKLAAEKLSREKERKEKLFKAASMRAEKARLAQEVRRKSQERKISLEKQKTDQKPNSAE